MKNKYSKKQLEELYNCEIFKDSGFDSSYIFWVAHGLPFTEDGEDSLFTYADGWDLNELHENIREAICEHCIVFDGDDCKENEVEIRNRAVDDCIKILDRKEPKYQDVLNDRYDMIEYMRELKQ